MTISYSQKRHPLTTRHSSRHLSTCGRVAVILLITTLTGCASVNLNPFKESEISSRGQADRQAAQAGVEPLTGALTLENAIARALKYNLGARTRMMEEALAMEQHDVSKYDMLPKLVAAAGYTNRNNDHTVRSVDSITGAASLANPSVSSDRRHATNELGLTWNLLDFGLGHVAATQNADRVLIAVEHRRKAMHVLVQDVRSSFWRAVSAQKLKGQVQMAIAQGEEALGESRKIEEEKLRSPLESLRYQKQLLENLRLLEAIDHELSSARIELASHANLPLGSDFLVVEPDQTLDPAILKQPIASLEEMAITKNADIREQHYNARIAGEETRKAVLRMFPNLGLNLSRKHDNDSYLINKSWREAGAQLSWNIFNLFSGPAQIRMAEAGITVADQRRIATQMAVLAQVHIAHLQYGNTIAEFQRADAMWQIDDRIAKHVLNQEEAQTQSKLERVATQTASILSLLRRYQALSAAHAAGSRLQATLGLEPNIASVGDTSLQGLTETIKTSLAEWQHYGVRLPETAIIAANDAPPTSEPAAQTAAQPDQSVAIATVHDRLNAWKETWGARQAPKHFSFYSTHFNPDGNLSRKQWQKLRSNRLAKTEAQPGATTDLSFSATDTGRILVRFPRTRMSNSSGATTLIEQQWANENGRWLIERETIVSQAQHQTL